ncbi:MAG TPA: hypothetical protein DEB06_09525 [Phycisphaerales bacterium]|nr:hypothetical protein [Phycisphaerales bacterium]
MRVLILGVGDAFTERGFGTSAVVEGPAGYLLIDCPDLIHRALSEASRSTGWKLDTDRIDDILITHLHGDHCNGLESFGFARLVSRLQRRNERLPRLHTHPAAAARVWERLAPAMDAPLHAGGRPSTLDDYFQSSIITPGRPATIAGLTVQCRYTIHPIPTIGLMISDGRSTLGWSGDTVFEQAHIDWLSGASVIVHEANIGPAHTQVELLNALPDPVRRKMRVTHIIDDFDPRSTDIRPLRVGEVLEF